MLEIKHLCSHGHVRKGPRGHPQFVLIFFSMFFRQMAQGFTRNIKLFSMLDSIESFYSTSISLRFDEKLVWLKRCVWIGPKQLLGTLARQDLVSCQIDILISAACRNEDFHDHILINSLNLSSLEGKNSSHLLTINFKSQIYLSRNCFIALLQSRR